LAQEAFETSMPAGSFAPVTIPLEKIREYRVRPTDYDHICQWI